MLRKLEVVQWLRLGLVLSHYSIAHCAGLPLFSKQVKVRSRA